MEYLSAAAIAFANLGYWADLSAFLASALLMFVYQWRLIRRSHQDPQLTIQGMNACARYAWVERVVMDGRDVMAVQTFRNSTMASTLMASTAIILILGILNLLANGGQGHNSLFQMLNTWGSRDPGMWIFKIIVLLLDFFVAFFSFSLVVRSYNHAGYLINVPRTLEDTTAGVTVQRVVQVLDQAAIYYSVGMRSYYLTVPLVLWLFGPLWMMGATVVLVAILNQLDYLED